MVKSEVVKTINKAMEAANMDFEVAVYVELMKSIQPNSPISPFVRCAYERYYGMAKAFLTDSWKNRYFEIMNKYLEKNEIKESLNLEKLMDEVGPDDKNVQPAFVSKLLHTLKNDEPIYDKYVRCFLEIGEPQGDSIDKRKEAAVSIYENKIKLGFFQNDDYSELRNLMLDIFNKKYNGAEEVSDIKKQDFIMWSLGKQRFKISELSSDVLL